MTAADTLSSILDAAAPPSMEYQRDAASPDALPYGEATQLNEASAGIHANPAGGTTSGAEQTAAPNSPPSETAQAAPEASYSPQGDLEKYLTGPTDEPMTSPTSAVELTLPPGYESWLVMAQGAASMPDASYWIKSFAQRASEAARVVEAQRMAQ